MAESPDKAADGAEKAYAAAAEAKPVATEVAKLEPAATADPVKAPPAPTAKPVAIKAVPKKAAGKNKAAPNKVATKRIKKPAAKAKPAAGKKPVLAKATPKVPPVASKPKPTITQLKEKIMATAKTADFTKPFADAVGGFVGRLGHRFLASRCNRTNSGLAALHKIGAASAKSRNFCAVHHNGLS